MSDVYQLKRLINKLHDPEQRRFGKTYSAVMLTKKVGGILISFNKVSAKQIAQEYGIETDSINCFQADGCRKPIIIDQEVFAVTCSSLLHLIEKQAAELKLARAKLEILDNACEEIALYSLSRPREMGEGDDGDGHYRRAANAMIGIAARAREE